jgi:hypothetical protein
MSNTEVIIGWIGRMANNFGGEVFDRELNRIWDWGQALCRLRWGKDWMNNQEFRDLESQAPSPLPDDTDVANAKAWETGQWPEWAKR